MLQIKIAIGHKKDITSKGKQGIVRLFSEGSMLEIVNKGQSQKKIKNIGKNQNELLRMSEKIDKNKKGNKQKKWINQ